MKVINLEFGRPYVKEALERLDKELLSCKKEGIDVAKIIHGYGSTGKGGMIKEACRDALSRRNDIKRIIYGEDFKILNNDAYELKLKEPELEDLFHCNNKGVTIIEMI